MAKVVYLNVAFYNTSEDVRVGLGRKMRYAFLRNGDLVVQQDFYTWEDKQDKTFLIGADEISPCEFDHLYGGTYNG